MVRVLQVGADEPTHKECVEIEQTEYDIIQKYRDNLSAIANSIDLNIESVQDSRDIKDALVFITNPQTNIDISKALGRILPPQLVKIQDHELKNLLGNVTYLAALEYCEKEQDKKKYFRLGFDSILASINYLDLLTNPDKRQNIHLNDLIDTFPEYLLENVEISKNVHKNRDPSILNGDGEATKEVVFNNLEEALSIRTLLHNAFKEKRGENKKISIVLIEKGTRRTFIVKDDISYRWNLVIRELVESEQKKGLDDRSYKGPLQGGLGMVAYLAGRRGDYMRLNDESFDDLGKKSVQITFQYPQIPDDYSDTPVIMVKEEPISKSHKD